MARKCTNAHCVMAHSTQRRRSRHTSRLIPRITFLLALDLHTMVPIIMASCHPAAECLMQLRRPRTLTRKTGNVLTLNFPLKTLHLPTMADQRHLQVLSCHTVHRLEDPRIILIIQEDSKHHPHRQTTIVITLAVTLIIILVIHKIRLQRCQFPILCFLLEFKSNRLHIVELPSFTLPPNSLTIVHLPPLPLSLHHLSHLLL